jgi:hypothetical protein
MVQRLNPAEQQQVDAMWDNMLSPPDRLDSQTLLDCLVVYQLHHLGVDELHLKSVKQTPEGKAIMTIEYDRERPADDRLTYRLVSRWGWTIRKERWSANQVAKVVSDLSRPPPNITNSPTTHPQLEQRLQRIIAATQPGLIP